MIEVLSLKQTFHTAKIIVGNTEVGVETKFKGMHYPVMIATTHVPELNAIEELESGVLIGASVTLTTIEAFFSRLVAERPKEQASGRLFCSLCQPVVDRITPPDTVALADRLDLGICRCAREPAVVCWAADPRRGQRGRQHRHRDVHQRSQPRLDRRRHCHPPGVIGTCVADFVSATYPRSAFSTLLFCSFMWLVTVYAGGVRKMDMADFFVAYRQTAMQPDEVITAIFVPNLPPHTFLEAYKQARRKDDDVAIANAGIKVQFTVEGAQHKVADIVIAYGGVGPKVVRATKTEQALRGLVWDDALLAKALEMLPQDVQLAPEAPGGMVDYRRTLSATFFFKFFLSVQSRINEGSVDARDLSAIERHERPVSKATHLYEAPLVGQPSDSIGQPIPHLAAEKQVHQ